MVQPLAIVDIREPSVEQATTRQHYDLGFWAAGYEARSSWLVQSAFKPEYVDAWWKIEFETHRIEHSARKNLNIDCGLLLGGAPGRQNHDGRWVVLWRELVTDAYLHRRRRLDIFIDYSSMPRAVYGSLLVECLRHLRDRINSITFAYVPGKHASDIDGSRGIQGLRPLIGTEGMSRHDRSAFVIGLGYDGILAQSVLELFQVAHFSCFYAEPGVSIDSVTRVLAANAAVLSRAELVASTPALSVDKALATILRLCDWYRGLRDVLLVPLGPKPHILASILAASIRPELGFRFPETSQLRPVEVLVADNAIPNFTEIRP